MALKQTYNHLFKGLTQNTAAMDKYLKALPTLSAISEQVKNMAHIADSDKTKHLEDNQQNRTKTATAISNLTHALLL